MTKTNVKLNEFSPENLAILDRMDVGHWTFKKLETFFKSSDVAMVCLSRNSFSKKALEVIDESTSGVLGYGINLLDERYGPSILVFAYRPRMTAILAGAQPSLMNKLIVVDKEKQVRERCGDGLLPMPIRTAAKTTSGKVDKFGICNDVDSDLTLHGSLNLYFVDLYKCSPSTKAALLEAEDVTEEGLAFLSKQQHILSFGHRWERDILRNEFGTILRNRDLIVIIPSTEPTVYQLYWGLVAIGYDPVKPLISQSVPDAKTRKVWKESHQPKESPAFEIPVVRGGIPDRHVHVGGDIPPPGTLTRLAQTTGGWNQPQHASNPVDNSRMHPMYSNAPTPVWGGTMDIDRLIADVVLQRRTNFTGAEVDILYPFKDKLNVEFIFTDGVFIAAPKGKATVYTPQPSKDTEGYDLSAELDR